MKKIFALLLMLAMVTVCGSAMAEIVITGEMLKGNSAGEPGVWSWDGTTLTLSPANKSAYTVKNWNTDGSIIIDLQEMAEYTVDLTLENVVIESKNNVITSDNDTYVPGSLNGNLNLTLKNTSLVSKERMAFNIQTSSQEKGQFNVNIKGENATLKGKDTGAFIYNTEGAAFLTLSGTVTIVGGDKAVSIYGNKVGAGVYIDGAATPGIHAEWARNVDGSSPTQVAGSPFSGMSDNVYSEIRSKKFLRLYVPEASADLPRTGDSSRLALWLCLLAIAGAGMTAMRKREA